MKREKFYDVLNYSSLRVRERDRNGYLVNSCGPTNKIAYTPECELELDSNFQAFVS